MLSSPSTPEVQKPANLDAQKLDTNQQTRAMPWWCGRRWFAVTWCVSKLYNYSTTKKSSGGKGGKGGGGAQEIATCDVAGLIACCTADLAVAIEVNGDTVWSGGISRGGSHPEHTGNIVVPDVGTFRLHWGTESASGDWLVLNSGGEEHPYYRGQPLLEAQHLNCGSSGSLPNIRVLLERAPRFAGLDESLSYEGSNPITALAELIEDDFFGLGMAGVVDVPTATAIANALAFRTKTLAVEGNPAHLARMSYIAGYLGERQSFGAFLAAVMENVDGWARRKGEKLEFGYFTHGEIDTSGLLELTLHDFVDEPAYPNPAPNDPEVITDAIVTGPDRAWQLEDSWQLGGNDAARDRIQETRQKTYARPFLVTAHQQKEQAQELANFYSVPAKETSFRIRREKVGATQPGDRVILNYGPSGSRLVHRVTQRSDPAGGGVVTLGLILERALGPLTYIAPADPAPELPDPPTPGPITHARMCQLPAAFTGRIDPIVIPLAERPTAPTAGFRIHYSVDDASYDYEGFTPDWALRGTLAGAIAAGAATCTLNAAGLDLALLAEQSAAAQLDDTLLLWLGDEIISIGEVTALGGGQYTVGLLRGRRGSIAAAHAAADEAWIIPRADLLQLSHAAFPRNGVERFFKLQAYNALGEQELSDALKLTLAFADTRPTAPVVTAVAGTGKIISLSWPKIASASEYAIYRNTSNTPGAAAKIAEVSGLRFVDVVPALATTYYYWVTAVDASELESAKSTVASATTSAIPAAQLDPDVLADLSAAIDAAADAQATADGKVTTFVQSSAPTAEGVGDLWIDTDDANKLYRWSGSAWAAIRDTGIATALTNAANAQATADGKVQTFYQSSAPTAEGVGDLWIDTDDANRLYRWSGSAWVDVRDVGIADAQAAASQAIIDAADAQATADGKVTTFVQSSAPTAEGVGDLWIDTDDANKLYRWSGSAWAAIRDTGIATALTNAANAQATADGKVQTFYQSSAPTADGVGDLWVDTDDANRLYRWSGSSWVDVQGIRSNAPSAPSAPTFNSSNAYVAGDGTVFSRIVVNAPAMPSGAAILNLLYRRSGASGWIVADQRTTGGGTTSIDDLTPGGSYQLGAQAFTNFGIGSTITVGATIVAPNKTALPSGPTSVVAHAPSSSYPAPAQYAAGGQLQIPVAVITFTAPSDRDIDHYEFAAVGPTNVAPAPTTSGTIARSSPHYWYTFAPLLLQNAYLYSRSVDTSGNASAWTYSGYNLLGIAAVVAGSISVQNVDSVEVTGIKTGGSGARQVRARYPFQLVASYSAGAEPAINVPITGFTAKPDGVTGLNVSSDVTTKARYDWDDAGNTSTNAVVKLSHFDGSAMVGGLARIHGEFFEYF